MHATDDAPPAADPATPPTDLDDPVLVRVWRSGRIESVHRGAWAVVDVSGAVVEGRGQVERPHYARSTIKSLQALPLIESGAAGRYELTDAELALALASHNAEAVHTDTVLGMLGRVELGVEHLRCGAQAPGAPEAREELTRRGERPSALHNNCSGKHAGFLTLARHLGADPASYLDPEGAVQREVRAAVAAMCGVEADRLEHGIDGCSAPTFLLSVAELATGFARMGTPDGLAPERSAACRRMTAAVAAHPGLIAGEHKRLCTALARVTRGRLFPKIGAEGLYCVAHVESGRALACKLDDGQQRGLHAATVGLLERLGWIDQEERAALAAFAPGPLFNWAGLEVGHLEVVE